MFSNSVLALPQKVLHQRVVLPAHNTRGRIIPGVLNAGVLLQTNARVPRVLNAGVLLQADARVPRVLNAGVLLQNYLKR